MTDAVGEYGGIWVVSAGLARCIFSCTVVSLKWSLQYRANGMAESHCLTLRETMDPPTLILLLSRRHGPISQIYGTCQTNFIVSECLHTMFWLVSFGVHIVLQATMSASWLRFA